MKNLNIFRNRDLEQLLTFTFEFGINNLWTYIKFTTIFALPFIIWGAILGTDLFVGKALHIFEIFNKAISKPLDIYSIANPLNLLTIVFYLFTISLVGALIYAALKLYKDGADIKKLNLKLIWNTGRNIFATILLFNAFSFILFTVYLFFFAFVNTLIFVGYTQFIWGFTLAFFHLAFLASAKIPSLNFVIILLLVFVLIPLLVYTFRLIIRCILLILYSLPLKLEEPDLSFMQRLVICNQLLDKEVFRSWVYIHIICFAVFFITFVCCTPFYGVFYKLGLLEQPITGVLLTSFFKCLSYGLAVFLAGFSHIAISLSFYSLYAKNV